MFESPKGFCTVLMMDPPRIQVKWDRIGRADFAGVKIFWWRIGESVTRSSGLIWDSSQLLITVEAGETYVIAAQAYYRPRYTTSVSQRSSWAYYAVIKVPQIDDQYASLGQVTVIDAPKGPALLLDELWDADEMYSILADSVPGVDYDELVGDDEKLLDVAGAAWAYIVAIEGAEDQDKWAQQGGTIPYDMLREAVKKWWMIDDIEGG